MRNVSNSILPLALHYNEEHFRTLLVNGINPFLLSINNLCFNIYFNDDRGKAIWLILHTKDDTKISELKDKALNHFKLFFETYPSKNPGFDLENNWFLPYPNNIIRLIDSSEYNRFNNLNALGINFIEHSKNYNSALSEITLEIANEFGEVEHLEILDICFNTLISMVFGFFQEKSKANSFFEDFFEKLVSKEGSTWQTIERRLEKDFKDNEETLSKHINSIWFDLSRDPLNGSNYESLNALAKTSNQIKTDLSKLGNAQKQQADVYLENLLNFSVMNLITQVSLLNYNTFFIFHSITKSLK